MNFNEDVWKIIKSFLFDEKEVQYRYFIKQINENLKKIEYRKRGLEMLESMSDSDDTEDAEDFFSL